MLLLENHIAVVTGAGSGIGRTIAAGFAAEGAHIVLLDIISEAAAEAAEQIREAGGTASHFSLDITDRDRCFSVARIAENEIGSVSILVNNAGLVRRNGIKAVAELAARDWQEVINTNLDGMFDVTQVFLPSLQRTRGRIKIWDPCCP